MKYEHPQLFLLIITLTLRNQQNKRKVLFYYPMLMYSGQQIVACFEHSNFFKVNDLEPQVPDTQWRAPGGNQKEGRGRQYTPSRQTGRTPDPEIQLRAF